MNYRSDIDGLRAIAVGLVILNHVGFSLFSGGYVGVDVFFVISGFLITAIIYPKIVKKDFTVSSFLSKRIKRLMPVLLFVILITMLFFTFILLPQDLVKFYYSVIWVVLYGANFFFWRNYGGYFDGGSQEAPLLHTWSLAVEEQYYLVWPIMLVLSIRYLGAARTSFISIGLLIVSTLFSQWGTEVTLGAAYYLLPTRFFELLLGSCLAIFFVKLPSSSQLVHNILSVIGIILIFGSALLLSEHSSFPGYNALYPTIGAALLIYSSKGMVNKILSTKGMVFTGTISYSLYLWHWPVFVIFRYLSVDFTLVVQFMAIGLTFVLAFLSWKYIEQPLRYIQWTSFKKVGLYLYVIPSTILLTISFVGIYNKGYPERYTNDIVEMNAAVNSFASKSRKDCHSAFRNSDKLPNESCIFGKGSNITKSPDVFIFGDSHANHLVPLFDKIQLKQGLSGLDYTLDRCLPIFDFEWGANSFMANKCKERNELARNYIENGKLSYVVMAGSWPHITTQRIFHSEERVKNDLTKESLFSEKLHDTISFIVNSGARPIFVLDTPTLGGKSPKCTIKKFVFNDSLDCSIVRNKNALIETTIAELKEKFPQIIVMNIHQLYCDDGICKMEIGGTPLYRDDDHLNERGAELLGEMYLKEFGTPFIN